MFFKISMFQFFNFWLLRKKSFFVAFLSTRKIKLLTFNLNTKPFNCYGCKLLKKTMSLIFCRTQNWKGLTCIWIYMLNFQQQISIFEALLLNSIDLVSLKIHCLVSHCKMFCRKETLKVIKLKMIFFNFFQLQLCLIKIFNFH